MGTFTMPLKEVIEYVGGTVDIVNGIAVMSGGNIGLNEYPIFENDEVHRAHLNGLIIDRYWNREIGQESESMFILAVRRKMNEIMPLYNQYYKSEKIVFDALSTVDIHTVSESDSEQNAASNATNSTETDSTNASRSVTSETPQTMLSGNGDYATAAADVNGVGNATSSVTEDTTADTNFTANSDTTMTGYQGAASDLLQRYRATFLNIDLQVVNELEDLFMLVWDTGDAYTNGGYFL